MRDGYLKLVFRGWISVMICVLGQSGFVVTTKCSPYIIFISYKLHQLYRARKYNAIDSHSESAEYLKIYYIIKPPY